MRALRLTDKTIYLRMASINLFNGMISLTFSCDGSHYMPYMEFLLKDTTFWFQKAFGCNPHRFTSSHRATRPRVPSDRQC
jgi:hypothetical protein